MLKIKVLTAALLAATMHQTAWAEESATAGAPAGTAPTIDTSSKGPAKKAFSTGVAKGRDLLDTAISASVIDEADLRKLSVSSTVAIIQNIPGIRAETSDIDGLTAVTVRGLPLSADGSKFLQLQEDGLPVMEFGDVQFASADLFVRADLTLSQVQAIRGGSASTFASNSPGGVINFISNTGETAAGAMQLSSGVGHDLKRLDFAYGSPLGNGWRFHVGGFYRQGEGPRDIGYEGFRGGQVKLNITKEFNSGYVRLYGKYLDDRQPYYGSYPTFLTGTNAAPKLSELPGMSLRDNGYLSQLTAQYIALDENNNPTTIDSRIGLRGISKAIGLEAQLEVAGWTVTNRFRYADMSGEQNGLVPLAIAPAQLVGSLLGGPGATLTYAAGPRAGELMGPATLAAISLRLHGRLNSLDNATNDLRASRVWTVGGGRLTTTAGLYASSQSIDMYWDFQTILNDLAGGSRNAPVNLVAANGDVLTYNGTYAYGFGIGQPLESNHRRNDLSYRILAPYGSINYQIGRLALGGSLRWDRGHVSGGVTDSEFGGGRVGRSEIDVNRDGVISFTERNVAVLPLGQPAVVNYNYDYISYSLGVNYRVAEPFSVFARYSRGARANAERILPSGGLNASTGKLNDPSTAFSVVKQAEAGLKYRGGGITAYVTGFWASTGEKNYQIGPGANGLPAILQVVRTYSARGIEFEGEVRHGPFGLTLGATWTDAKIDKDQTNPALKGNRPRHVPTVVFQARPQADFGPVTIGTVINGTTESFAQDSNVLTQPGYTIVSPYLQYRPTDRVSIGLNAFNVFDKLAVVVLTASSVSESFSNAQVMNGRTVTGSVRFAF